MGEKLPRKIIIDCDGEILILPDEQWEEMKDLFPVPEKEIADNMQQYKHQRPPDREKFDPELER